MLHMLTTPRAFAQIRPTWSIWNFIGHVQVAGVTRFRGERGDRAFCLSNRAGSRVALGGLDALVFTAGIGENDVATCAEVVDDCAWLGLTPGTPRYFLETRPVSSAENALQRLQSDDISLVIEIPPSFGRDLRRGSQPEVLAQVDGANTFRGETVSQYVQSVQDNALRDPANDLNLKPPKYQANFQDRYMYNPTFESVYAMVPSVPPILLILIPAILMAISVVREKELGSIINFYVTPTARLEYLLGKQIPYIAIGMLNYFILVAMAILVFGIPIKGSFLMLTLTTLLYVTTTTGIGLVISTFVSSQVAAVFITAIITLVPTIQFSGLLQPVSTLAGRAKLIGTIWPTSYYMHASKGAFTKGLGADLLMQDVIFLAVCIPILWTVSTLALRKQEK